MRKIQSLTFALAALLMVGACKRDQNLLVREETNNLAEKQLAMERFLDLPPNMEYYGSPLPKYLVALGMVPQRFNHEKATIGRVLFYDKNLSKDRTISCASCHKQALAFSDDVAFSPGIGQERALRNSMALSNVANMAAHHQSIKGSETPLFLWDGRAKSIAELSKMAMTSPHEMGMTMPEVVERVKAMPYYPYLWEMAFQDMSITEEGILDCLSEFVEAMGSYQTRFDFAMERVNGDVNFNKFDTTITVVSAYNSNDSITAINRILLPGFTLLEDDGRRLFVKNCTKCHSPIRPLQNVFEACNGLDVAYKDQGKGAITGLTSDNGVFKSPSLRNIALSAPYMHDGRFRTLEQVVNFYNNDIQDHPNLHPTLRDANGKPKRLNMSTADKKALVAFLHTLTDDAIASDRRFSNPIREQ